MNDEKKSRINKAILYDKPFEPEIMTVDIKPIQIIPDDDPLFKKYAKLKGKKLKERKKQ